MKTILSTNMNIDTVASIANTCHVYNYYTLHPQC